MTGLFEMTTTGNCPWCDKAKALLAEKGLEFRATPLDTPEKRSGFKAAGFTKVPQIWHNGNHIGGFTELDKYLQHSVLPLSSHATRSVFAIK